MRGQERPPRPGPEYEWYSSATHKQGGWWQRNGQRKKATRKDRDRVRKRAKPKALQVRVQNIEDRARAREELRAAIERAKVVDRRSPAEVRLNQAMGAVLGAVAMVGAVGAAWSLWVG